MQVRFDNTRLIVSRLAFIGYEKVYKTLKFDRSLYAGRRCLLFHTPL